MREIAAQAFAGVFANVEVFKISAGSVVAQIEAKRNLKELNIPFTPETCRGLGIELHLVGCTSASKCLMHLAEEMQSVSTNWDRTLRLLKDFPYRINDDLMGSVLLLLDLGETANANRTIQHVDTQISNCFPSLIPAIQEAFRGYALGSPGACVYHCMLVINHLLQALAKHMGVYEEVESRHPRTSIGRVHLAVQALNPPLITDPIEQARVNCLNDIVKYVTSTALVLGNLISGMALKYTEYEATEYLNFTRELLRMTASVCDENGNSVYAR